MLYYWTESSSYNINMMKASYSDLAGKVVFITGGASGIGAGFVRGFAEQGATVYFVSLPGDHGEVLCDTIEKETQNRPTFIACDIRDIAALDKVIASIVSQHQAIDILINNAGRDSRHEIGHYSAEEWDDALNINLRPHYFTAQAVAKAMRKKGGGSIINLSSNSALIGIPGYASYVAAKAGIIGLSKALARELGPDNIRVNSLIPGWVMTERQKELWVTPEAIEQCLAEQSLKRTLEVEDIVNAALFLASDASAMMSGQMMIVDGGRV